MSTKGHKRQHTPTAQTSPPSLIVGIGASAGGLAAFNAFFSHMPVDCGMAFVLVQHLAPDHNSILAELIGRETPMPVLEAEDGIRMAPNHVYVIPPNATLTIEDGVLCVSRPAPPREHRRPIDTFFASLGEHHKERSVGIVLSGVGSDGSQGLGVLKENGGLTLAQADFDSHAKSGMPSSAAATGLVDFVMPVESMPQKLIEYEKHLNTVLDRKKEDGTREDVAQSLTEVTKLLRERTGHDFSGYKENTLVRRIQRRMQVLQVETVADYTDQLRDQPDESDALFRELDIGVTQFFRDPGAFDSLKSLVLAQLVRERKSGEQIRIWVPGCATGEEVYSIAILLREMMSEFNSFPPVVIFGTDIDARSVSAARAARFTKAADSVSPERLERWFRKDGDAYCLIPAIREMCIFSAHSVAKDPPFSRVDLISCRNLLIYLDSKLQHRVMETFHYSLRSGGHLFLGTSESVTREAKLFSVIDRSHRLLRRRDDVRVRPFDFKENKLSGALEGVQRPAGAADLIANAADRLLAPHSPVALVVDRHHEILRFLGGELGPYLDPSPGVASLKIFGILRGELRAPVRAAVQSAKETQRPVSYDVSMTSDGQTRLVKLIVEPIVDENVEKGLCLIVLRERSGGGTATSARSGDTDTPGDEELRSIKEQLEFARNELENYVEEMRLATEEYQSANEEFQSTNEELETAKEEMQSINEELQTINSELNVKNDLLTHVNNDLQNLLDSTQIATIFLDEALRIKNFTPASTLLFPLRETDRGRAITDIVNLLSYDELLEDTRSVLRDQKVVERHLSLKDDTATYQMRIRPYRTIANVIEGVVITFVDVTQQKLHEDQMRLVMGELSHRTNNLLAVILAIAKQSMTYSDDAKDFYSKFQSRIISLSHANELLVSRNWMGGGLAELVQSQLAPFVDVRLNTFEVHEPSLILTPIAVQSIGLALHELATNASKHGALSVPGGKIAVHAELSGGDDEPKRFRLEWRETDGPSVVRPQRKGFGHIVLERLAVQQLDANAAFEFAPEGVRWTLDAPVDRVITFERP